VKHRLADQGDLPLLARLNHELIQDEGANHPMTLDELQARMHGWLSARYQAVLFEESSQTVGYALFRQEEEGVHLRQFFIARGMRRRGYGREAMELLLQEVWPKAGRVTVEVLHHNAAALAFWRVSASRTTREHSRALARARQGTPTLRV